MAEKKKEDKAEGGLPEVDIILKGLLAEKGVEGFLVYNDAGIPIKWTNTGFIKPGTLATPAPIPPAIIHHTALAHDLTIKAKLTCRKILGDEGELQLMRLHTHTKEYIIAPAEHETLLVVQAAHSAALEPLVLTADAAQMAALANAKGGKDEKAKK